jgi:hypothetical protein
MALLARDHFLPHMFALRADRQVHRYGVVVLALAAAALLVAAKGTRRRWFRCSPSGCSWDSRCPSSAW